MNRFLLSFVFLLTLLFAFSGSGMFAQGREGGKDPNSPILKGQRGILLDLENEYCSGGADDLIKIPDSEIPGDAVLVRWEVTTNYGDGLDHPDYIENASGATITGSSIYLKPNLVDSIYWDNTRIYLQYYFVNGEGFDTGTTKYDYSFVKRSPWVFDLTTSEPDICDGETATLVLSGSETDYEYLLFRDGVEIEPQAKPGSGGPLNFTVSGEGEYTVQAVRTDGIICGEVMDGAPYITVYPNPTPAPDYRPASGTAGDPICQGLPFELFDSNPLTPGYEYNWTGPGLSGAVTGHTIPVSDPAVLGNPGDYTYRLTIIDQNNPTDCDAFADVTVTVQDNPTATPSINPPAVCEGSPVDIIANASDGAGSYSYIWSTADNPSFSSVDQATITIDPTSLDDDGDVYTVVVTDAVGCQSAATDAPALVVNEEPSVTISGASEVCEENPITFTTTDLGSGFEYQWFLEGSPLGTGSSITLGGGTYALPAVGTDYTISVEVRNTSTTCSTTESTLFTVNDKPEVSIDDPIEVCNGTASFTLTADFDNGEGVFPDDYNIQWYKGGSPLTGETTETLTLNNIDETDEATYTVIVEHLTTGCSDSFDHALTVHTINPTLSASPSEVICADQNVIFTASGTDAFEYRFLLNGVEVQAFSADDTWASNTLSDGDEITVEITDVNGCSDISAPITMTVNDRPVITDIDNGGPYCVDDNPVELFSTVSGGDISTSGDYTYSWTAPSGFTSGDEDPSFGPATLTMAQTYTLVATDDNNCSSVPATTDLVVNALPNSSAANDGPKCGNGNEDITLQGDPNGMVPYEWFAPGADLNTDAPIGTTQDYVLNNVLPAQSGIYTLRVVNSNGCVNITTTEVIVNELPVVSLGNDVEACLGEDVILTANITNATTGSYTYTWYVDTGSGWTQVASGVDMDTYTLSDVQLSDAASYSVIVNDGNTCASPRDVLILTVNDIPTVTPSATDICAGVNNDISLEGNPDDPDYSYSWSGPGLIGSVSGQDVSVTNDAITNTPGTYTYTLTITNTITGCSNSATVDAEVFENPSVDIPAVDPVCQNNPFTVTANVSGGVGPYNYSWTFDDGSGAVPLSYSTNTFTVDPASLSDAGTYEVTVTDTGNPTGCTSTASVAVVVHDLPTVNLPDASTCDGQDITLVATPSVGSGNYVNYTWYDAANTEIQNGASDQLTLTGADVALANDGATYSVTVTDDNGCESAPANMTLTVNEKPTVEIFYNTNPETAIDVCLGSSMTLDAQGSGGTNSYTYTWELPDGSTQTGAQLVVDPMALTDDGVYTVTVDDGNCIGTQTIDVTVVEVTATIAVTAPVAGATTICENTSVTFEAGGGDSYEFYFVDASAGTTTMVHDASNEWTTSTLEDGDEVYVTAFNTLGCSDDSDPIIMSVITNPTVAINYPAGEDNEICVGEDLPVVANPAGYANYDFYVSDGTTDTKVSPDGYASETFTYLAGDLDDGYEIYVVASSGAGCSGESAHETVVVHALPNATADNTGPECVNQTVTLQGGDAGLDTYEWFAPGADLNTDAPIATSMDHDLTNITSSDAGIYILRVTNVNGCQATATTEVVVNELPVISLPADYSVCEGTQNHEISATIINGTAPYNVVWEFDDGSGTTTVLSGQAETIFSIGSVSAANEGTYTVTVTDANGCVSVQDDLILTVDPAPTVSFNASSVNEVCDGTQLTLIAVGDGGSVSGSNPSGYEYVWYHEGTLVPGVSTATYQFTGENGVNDGLYEVRAIDDSGSGCESPLASINVTVHELPDATLDVDPAFFIEGTEVTFTAIAGYTSYEFELNGTSVQGPVAGNTYVSSTLVDQDEVTVIVREDHGTVQCENSSTVTMTVFDSVDKPVVTVTDQEYCEGSTGATITVDNPQQDVTYELVYDDGTPVTGYSQIIHDGTNTISWSNVLDDNGGTSTPTTFRVKAFWAALTPDGDQLSDPFDITEHPVPVAHTMTVGGTTVSAGGDVVTVCDPGAGGYSIGLEDSWSSDEYVLVLNGTQHLDTVTGGPSPLVFNGLYAYVGIYTIYAFNSNGCITDMIGSFTIDGTAVTVFDLTGDNGGQYCEGGTGVELTLSGSESGVDYELFRDGASQGTFTGDGSALSLGNYDVEGQYSVQVTTSGGCIYPMNGVVDVEMIPTPEPGNLTATNDGHFCAGGTGVDMILEITQVEGVAYQLFEVSTNTLIGSSVDGTAGGGDITFETDFTTEGSYQVRALAGTIACPALSNEITVVADPLLDTDLSTLLINEKCGPAGTANIGISNSETDVEYQWENTSTSTVGSTWESGNGGVLSFEVLEEGIYIFHALRTGTVTGCTSDLTNSVEVIERPLPNSSVSVTPSGGTDCNDGIIFTIDIPEVNIEYGLYKLDNAGNPVYVQSSLEGDGSAPISFNPVVDNNAQYYIDAVSDYGCRVVLDGAPWNVNISGAVEKFALKPGSGDICNGEDGIVFYLDNSVSGVDYVLSLEGAGDTRNDTVTSTGGMVEFAPVLEEGTYYVTGLSGVDPSCNSEMLNRVDLTVRPLPKAFNMVGPGKYCDVSVGVTLGIDNSQNGFEYVLQQHTAAGKRNIETLTSTSEGDTIFFSTELFESGEDIYSVVAISPFGCTSSMKDSIEVEQNNSLDIPVILDNVGVENDTVYFCDVPSGYYTIELETPQMDNGIVYQVFDDAENVVVETTVESSTMDPLNVVDPGTYTVRASLEDGACMTEADTIWVIGPLPAEDLHDPEYTSRVCYGDTVSIKYPDDDLGWTYQLMEFSGTAASPVSRDTIFDAGGDTIVWNVVDEGKYFISIQSEGAVCDAVSTATIEISIADQIQLPSFTDAIYYYCHNEDRVTIEITGVADVADGNFVYRLIDGDGNPTGAVFNDDANLFFEPVVGAGTPDAYGLLARDLDSGCEAYMEPTAFVDVIEYSRPISYNVLPADSVFNPDDGGVQIGLDNSQDEVDYFLVYNGESNPVDTIHVGTGEGGNEISFDPVVRPGVYEVYAKFSTRNCEWILMNGTSNLIEEGVNNYEGQVQSSYCEDDPNAVIVSLVGSDSGVLYRLMRSIDGAPEVNISERIGDGGMIGFKDNVSPSNYEKELTYRIVAESNGAVIDMNQGGDPLVSTVWHIPENQLFTIQNGGGQCVEGYPLELALDSAESGYSYQLQYNPDYRLQTNSFEDEQLAQQYFGSGEYPSWSVTKSGDYRVVPFNSGCYAPEPYDVKSVSVFRDPGAEDFLLRIPENEILGIVDVMENAVTDSRLDDTDYWYEWVYPVPDDTISFSFIDATVEFNYDDFNNGQFEGSPFIQYTRPAGFIGKDSILYSINIGVCPESKLDSGLITVIVGNEVLPNDDEILIPNAFSPNGDGMNDYFVLSGVPNEGQTTLMVFNRWGNLVYESNGRRYQNDWDGSANISNMVSIGQSLPNGVYFYIFSVKMTVGTTLETKEYNGYIELRR